MIAASFYVIVCTARNRVRARVRRLRQPRYAIGLLATLAYVYFSIFRVGGGGRPVEPGPGPPPDIVAAMTQAGAIVTASLLVLATVVAWFVPLGSGLLDFSRAEIQFLYPAPVHRRWLLVHRLLRSQLGLLFASLVPAVVFASGGAGGRLRFVASMWLVLVTLRLYFTGVNLARPRLNADDPRARWFARVPVILTMGIAAAIAIALGREFAARPVSTDLAALGDRLAALARVGPSAWLLTPFLALVRPLFVRDWSSYAAVLPGALAVVAVALLWVLESDQAFEAATEAAVEGHDRRQSTLTRQRYTSRATPWALRPRGSVEGALLWKAATESIRLLNVRALAWPLLPLTTFGLAGSVTGAFRHGLVQLLAAALLLMAGFVTAMGPQVVRSDLRRDLVHLDVLRTWPVDPGSLIRGAMLWPAACLTLVTWFGVVGATLLAPWAFPEIVVTWRVASAGAALALAPALIAAQLVIHNGVALVFPAWVSLGGQRPRGLDAMGQRLITLGGSWFMLAIVSVPGAVAGGLIWTQLARVVGPLAMVPAAAVCSVVLLVESHALTSRLGPLFDRLDLTDIERVE